MCRFATILFIIFLSFASKSYHSCALRVLLSGDGVVFCVISYAFILFAYWSSGWGDEVF